MSLGVLADRLPDDAFRETAASESAGKEEAPVHIVPKAQAGTVQGSVRQRAGFQHEVSYHGVYALINSLMGALQLQ